MQPSFEPDAMPLLVERVEWVPASLETIEVRVHGRWDGDVPAAEAVLLVDDDGRRQAFPAVTAGPGAVAPWTASFVVPGELRPRLRAGLRLGVGEGEVALPAAVAGAMGPVAEAEVIDRAVLAERRARRAEQGQESLAERAAEAEQAAVTLEAQLSNLEQRLAGLTGERERLIADLATRERELRGARQREHAEHELRLQAEDERDALRRELEDELRALRAELAATRERATVLQGEGDRMRAALAAERPAAIHDPRLTAMQAQVDALRSELGRWRAEEEGEEEQAPADDALAALVADLRATIATLRDAFEREIAAIAGEVADMRRELDAERAARRAAEAELEGARRPAAPAGPVSAAAQEVIDDLAAAARRLREQAGQPEPEPDAEAPAGPALVPSLPQPATPRGWRRLLPGTVPAPSWLSRAVAELAEADAATGARLFAALLGAQHLGPDRDLVYDVSVTEFGAFRVTLASGSTRVRPEPALLPGLPALELEGPASALAPLAGGGAPRRLRDVRVDGSRRALRRLLKATREPVGLPDLARAGVWVSPGLLLAALARMVDPAWTRGHRFAVAHRVEGRRGGTWTVVAADGAPLTVTQDAGPGAPAATVRLAEEAALPHLAGLTIPMGATAVIEGDAAAAATLAAWFARVQEPPPGA